MHYNSCMFFFFIFKKYIISIKFVEHVFFNVKFGVVLICKNILMVGNSCVGGEDFKYLFKFHRCTKS